VSAVGRGMCALDGLVIVEAEGADLGVELGASRCNQWGLCCVVVRERRAFPKLFWGGLVTCVDCTAVYSTWRVDGDGERCSGGGADSVGCLTPVFTGVAQHRTCYHDAAAASPIHPVHTRSTPSPHVTRQSQIADSPPRSRILINSTKHCSCLTSKWYRHLANSF